MPLKLDAKYLKEFVTAREYRAILPQLNAAHAALHQRTGEGNDFLGWLQLPQQVDGEELRRVKAAAQKICANSQVLIVVGIGGSYLGARAAIELLCSPNYNLLPHPGRPQIFFAGNSLNATALNEILDLCEGRDVSVNMISKSGTTTEPGIAFRLLREYLVERYGDQGARERIYCTTDAAKGKLRELALQEGYETFVIPDDVGGRYSVLTPVGLLPMACAGIDIDQVLQGARDAMEAYMAPDLLENDCYHYAVLRNLLARKGKCIELLVSYEPAFTMMGEWFKQLFGESEGKDGKGIFPATATFSTDLHSMGQFIQQGSRNLFETVVNIRQPQRDRMIPREEGDFDGLNFLSGQPLSQVNSQAMLGTILAHTQGGVPNIVLNVDKMDAYEYGWMVYFFEKACAISGYLLGVNPFDQPGVEQYKQNMFALLGKPGYEQQRQALQNQLQLM